MKEGMVMKDNLTFSHHPLEPRLNQIALNTVPQFGWFWLVLLIVSILGILTWAVMGTVQINIQGKGIILNQSGLFTIQTPIKGVVRTIFVKPGDLIQKGALIAEIFDAEKEMLLRTTQIKIDTLDKEVKRLRRQVEIEWEASKRSLETQLASLEFDIKTLNERLKFLDRELKKRQDLYHEGLIILNVVQETERQIAEAKISIEEKKGDIADTRAKLKKSYRTEELKTKEMELLKAEGEALVIQTTLKESKIQSPFDGKILEILLNPGEVVNEGQALVNAEFLSSRNELLFYGYFPSEFGKHVRKGNVMRMSLSTVNEKEFGSILSHVQEVSDYAISEKALVNLIHNTNLANFLTNRQPVTQVIAIPIPDDRDPSGFAWTSGKGPPIELSTGIVGTVEVTVESIHPIYYLIPLKKFKNISFRESL
jgi:HlyD family secretion protein